MVALPRGPMSTLPRESGHLSALISEGDATWRQAGAKLHDRGDGQQLVLIFDRRLVLKENTIPDTYMQVSFEQPIDHELDAVGALTHALMRSYHEALSSSPNPGQLAWLTEDIPRVVAGMFRVARSDANLSFTGQGEFVDSESALRLTEVVGLDRNQKSCRDRVAAVRHILSNVELSRTVRAENGKGTAVWTGPIIQRLKDKVDVSADLPDGLGRANKRLGVWRIAPELWRMQDPAGPAASFMLLDERAFELSTRSSEPFNFYWTIVQRAYNARRATVDLDKFDEEGVFCPTLEVLYTWSGMDRKSDAKNPARLATRLIAHFDLLVERELIESFDRTFFDRGNFSFKRDMRRRVAITLPSSLLRYLPGEAFRDGRNAFRATALS